MSICLYAAVIHFNQKKAGKTANKTQCKINILIHTHVSIPENSDIQKCINALEVTTSNICDIILG
jgi:hypothetical protein